MKGTHATREVLVLLSGGIDSTACVHFYIEFGRLPSALFIDYGQPAAKAESRAASIVAAHYGVPLRKVRLSPARPKADGLVVARNAFILATAMMEARRPVSMIAIGAHAGTDYPDCSEQFLANMQAVADLSGKEGIEIAAPFLTWTKADILAYCELRGVPLEKTYSCERGGRPPCGLCRSCRDREAIDARAKIEAEPSPGR